MKKETCLCRYVEPALKYIFGSFNQGSFEQRIALIACFSVAIIAFVATLSNLLLGLWMLSVVTLALSLVSLAAFLVLRKGYFSKRVIFFVALGAFLYYNFAWYFNFGAQGPTLFAFISIYIFFTLVWERKRIYWLVVISFLNLLVFYLIERHYLLLLGSYRDYNQRIEDLYSSIAFVLIIVFILTIYIKLNYLDQYEKAKRSDELKTAFLANMSHEIRTPLNAIVGFSSILSQEELSKEEKQSINRILELNAKQLLFLIEDIIDLSKIEVNEFVLFRSQINISRFFKKIADEVAFNMPEEKRAAIQFRYDINAKSATLFGDERRIEQVIRLLVANSFLYSDKGTVTLSLMENEDCWDFAVRDEGWGIKPEQLDTIFELFVKHKRRDNIHESGVGMGLHLARKLVELMSGTITVDSVYGQGSVFRFSIPKQSVDGCDFR